MIRTSHLLAIFIPALLVVGFTLFIQVLRYEPLYPTQAPAAAGDDGAVAEVHVPIAADDPILGDRSAPITLIAFEDFGCEACNQQHTLFAELLKKNTGRGKIIW